MNCTIVVAVPTHFETRMNGILECNWHGTGGQMFDGTDFTLWRQKSRTRGLKVASQCKQNLVRVCHWTARAGFEVFAR